MDENTVDRSGPHAAWPHRTPLGTTWRGVAVLAFTLVAMAAGAWLGSLLVPYDDRAVTLPTGPVALAVGGLIGAWLRARNGFLAVGMIGSLVGSQAGAHLLHDGRVSLHPPYLAHSHWTTYEVSLLALGTVAALVAVVWGTVSGHRRPRPYSDRKQPDAGRGSVAEDADPGESTSP
ncbi:hypothetical protein ABZ446_42325 [Streptomyces sp. NPDC005813]|uniref:hypothetical protein n=1 Tax=Streptomyces sp. NPDC005813 TaxID=3155592 RepID=UPI00340F4ACA